MTAGYIGAGATDRGAVPRGTTSWRPQTLWASARSNSCSSHTVRYQTSLRLRSNWTGYRNRTRTNENQVYATFSPPLVYLLDRILRLREAVQEAVRGGMQKSKPGLRLAEKDKWPHDT